ncbi:Na/Pi cotransporter family protein [Exilibacterium tricleocarpae]|uniref:Na/Pi cotransporter family protein n=1 Tax=Exilibacterium tricleocarpae TaxID=2591008 RepID=A0A545TVC8_9GAMM|nr:Na/Pi symporter [Exilibacterium tricleocarpae]TQV81175.1 Na/Pi cotransporter family protein [Exilibacterium tricleocarpae]
MDWSQFGALLGGIGLLLLGMGMMTEGLRLAAGRSLLHLLETSTRTPVRGVATGFLITTSVQSSSAVTAATIGFANAGILKLKQAAWIIYGSNIGTTMTGWLVALIGLNLKIEAFALPFIGIGMALQLAKKRERLAAVGTALTGFGALFLGISFLKHAMEGNTGLLDLSQLDALGIPGVALGVVAGALMTTVMQSSSAVLAIILTASASQVVSLHLGAALVIGANIGTTSTALLSVIGATASAKRLACLHLVFNTVTAAVALLLLWPLLALQVWLMGIFDIAPMPASQLAVFHTLFNVLGVIIMWYPTPYLIKWLKRKVVEPTDNNKIKPKYIDNTVLSLPELGVNALYYELVHVTALMRQLVEELMDSLTAPSATPTDWTRLQKLLNKIANFAVKLGRTNLPQEAAADLMVLTRVSHNFRTAVHDIAEITSAAQKQANYPLFNAAYTDLLRVFVASLDMTANTFEMPATHGLNKQLSDARHDQREALLIKGAAGETDMAGISAVLQQLNITQRLCEQLYKATQLLNRFGASRGLPADVGDAAAAQPPAESDQSAN